mgnify:CR=1 FL=1
MGDPRLTSRFNVFACDARFHGWTTGGPRTEHTLENSAECIIATLVGLLQFPKSRPLAECSSSFCVSQDQMDFPSYCLYGEGVHGSNIAAWIAIKRKEKVQAMMLASPGYLAE